MMKKKRILLATVAITIIITILIASLWPRTNTPSTETISTNNNQTPQNSGTDGTDTQNNTTPSPLPTRTSAEITESITKQDSSLTGSNDLPIFTISGSTHTKSNWYVVTITNNQDPTVGNAKVVLKDDGTNGLIVVAGPGTKFSRDSFNFPEDVWKLL